MITYNVMVYSSDALWCIPYDHGIKSFVVTGFTNKKSKNFKSILAYIYKLEKYSILADRFVRYSFRLLKKKKKSVEDKF